MFTIPIRRDFTQFIFSGKNYFDTTWCMIGTSKYLAKNKIVHYATSAMKRFLTSVSLQHEPKASDVITLVKKTFFARVSYEILYHEVWKCGKLHFHTRSEIKTIIVRNTNLVWCLLDCLFCLTKLLLHGEKKLGINARAFVALK